MRLWSLWILALCAFGLSAVASAAPFSFSTQEESRFLQLLNGFRSQLGLAPVQVDPRLQAAAKKHSNWMALQDVLLNRSALSHYGPTPTTEFSERIHAEGYLRYSLIGENVACGNGDPDETFKQFAFSGPHLQNMMNPRYRQIGIARAGTGSEKCPFYWTTNFGAESQTNANTPLITDTVRIANAIDSVVDTRNEQGLTTLQLLSNPQPQAPSSSTPARLNIECAIGAKLGYGVLTWSQQLTTYIEIKPEASTNLMRVSFAPENSSSTPNAQYASYSVSGAAVVKNIYYPLVTIFSAPNNRLGGFMIQIDTTRGVGQFDPYPGSGGKSGTVNCRLF